MEKQCVRFYTPKDYPLVCEMWRSQGWTPIPELLLPKVGVIVDNVAAGFLYQTDSKWAVLEFVVGSAKADKDLRRRGLDLVLAVLSEKAKELGYISVFSSISHPRLMEAYEQSGFIKTDTGMNSMVKFV